MNLKKTKLGSHKTTQSLTKIASRTQPKVPYWGFNFF